MDIPIHPTILAIHIHIDARINHRVIQRGIKHRFLVFSTLTVNDSQFLFPCVMRLLANSLKTLTSSLSCQVLLSSFCRNSRQSHLYHQIRRCLLVEVEISHHAASRYIREIMIAVKLAPETIVILRFPVNVSIILNRFGKRDGEVCIIRTCPTVGDTISCKQSVILHSQGGPKHFAIIVIQTMQQVKYDSLCVSSPRESIFMNAHAFGCGQLGMRSVF